MTILDPNGRIFVALDTTDVERAASLADRLKGVVVGVKLGKEFFAANGPQGVKRVSAAGLPLFLDLKFHDIPNTVAGAVRAALALKPFMLNVHASGGAAMMKAAVKAAAEAGDDRPLMLAVTVLTSLDDEDLKATGVVDAVFKQVARLAALARDCGMDGVVCSAFEAGMLRQSLGPDFKLVVPGVRPDWASSDDQKRIMTPVEAVTAGADYLVVGRPITGAVDPRKAAERIAAEVA